VTKLSVNLNAIALLRNRRALPWPDLIRLARIAMNAGSHGLTVHPRPDQRHIRFSDLPDLKRLLQREFPDGEFNIEGYPSEEFLQLVAVNRPDQVTLVPDSPEQSTSDHGWDFDKNAALLDNVVQRLHAQGCRVSLFANAQPEGLEIARQLGAERIEFYTGIYGAFFNAPSRARQELESLRAAAEKATGLGLGINAGHDLTVDNLPALCEAIPSLLEVSIGHALIADALEFGLAQAVKRFLATL
jgi:pyridoxine 5-phosphate synthase